MRILDALICWITEQVIRLFPKVESFEFHGQLLENHSNISLISYQRRVPRDFRMYLRIPRAYLK